MQWNRSPRSLLFVGVAVAVAVAGAMVTSSCVGSDTAEGPARAESADGQTETEIGSTPTTSDDGERMREPQDCGPTVYEFPADLFPFRDRCLDLGFGDYHYIDEMPESEPAGTALMVHGNPVSSFVYRQVAGQLLARGYRVVAMDHYGFGQSAKPTVEEFGYRPSDHLRVLTEFVDALDLQDVTLLVQDWGGPVGLGMAVERPDRVENILIMNTWAWQVTPEDRSGPFGALVRWSQLAHDLSDQLVSTGMVITGATAGLAAPYEQPLADRITEAFLGPFFDPATGGLRSPTVAQPTVTFAQSILDDTEMFATLGDLEPITDMPVYFFYGSADPIFGALTPDVDGTCATGTVAADGIRCVDGTGAPIHPYIDRFTAMWKPDKIRGTEVTESANHFIQDNEPERVAEIIELLNGR